MLWRDVAVLSLLTTIIRLMAGWLFVIAGFYKLQKADASMINRLWPSLSSHASKLHATVGALEIAVGVLLLFGWWPHLALALAQALIVIFTMIIIIAARRGLSGSCNCFPLKGRIGFGSVARNVCLLLLLCATQSLLSLDKRIAEAILYESILYLHILALISLVFITLVAVMASQMVSFLRTLRRFV